MALSILNNVASLAAQNQLNITGAALQKTLFQLSSGSRINSGADDAAGLAIADGLQANITALTQSARNANDGVGKLQVADGALAQITTLLNRAVTLATESATGTVSSAQRNALDAEYTAIKAEIDRIGTKTTYNGTQVFTDANTPDVNTLTSSVTTLTLTTALTNAATTSFTSGGQTFTFTAGATSTVADLIQAINNPSTDSLGLRAYLSSGALVVTDPANHQNVAFNPASTETVLGTNFTNPTVTGAGATNVYLSDSTSGGASTIGVAVGALTSSAITSGGNTVNLNTAGTDLTTAANAQAALTQINQAVQNVAGIRGTLGAGINRLQSASNVITNQVQNLTSAQDSIRAADIPSTVAQLTKYSILNQTGVAALAQANQMQQLVLSLLK